MLAYIVSDNQAAAENLRRVLVEQRIDCGIPNILTTDRALDMSTRFAEAAELVFVMLSSEIDRALSIITSVRKSTRARLVAVGSAQDPQRILRGRAFPYGPSLVPAHESGSTARCVVRSTSAPIGRKHTCPESRPASARGFS